MMVKSLSKLLYASLFLSFVISLVACSSPKDSATKSSSVIRSAKSIKSSKSSESSKAVQRKVDFIQPNFSLFCESASKIKPN